MALPSAQSVAASLASHNAKVAAGTAPAYNPGGSEYNAAKAAGQVVGTGTKATLSPGLSSNNTAQSTTTLSSNKATDILNTSNGINNMKMGSTSNTDTGASTYANGYAIPEANTSQEDDTLNTILKGMLQRTDADTANAIQSIQNKYSLLKNQQQKVNESQSAATQGALFRSGAAQGDAYANNTVGYQTQQNLNAMQALDMQQEDSINAAKAAQSAGYARVAEMKYNEALDAKKRKLDLADQVNKQLADAQVKAQQAQIQSQKEDATIQLYNQGITDPGQIVQELTKAGIPATLKEVSDNVALLSGIGGSGIVGEYNFYVANAKKNGQVPVDFNTYQNIDANRKAKVASAAAGSVGGGAGLNPKEATIFNAIVDKYNKSPLVAAVDRTAVLENIIKNVKADPNNPAQQLSLAYGFVQALDTYKSSVREGELHLINSIDSKAGQLENYAQQMTNGQIVRPEVAKQIADAAQTLVDAIKSGATQKQKAFAAQAKQNGSNVSEAFNSFLGAVNDSGTTADTVAQTEDQAKGSVLNYGKTNPTAQEQIRKMVLDGVPYLQIKATLNI